MSTTTKHPRLKFKIHKINKQNFTAFEDDENDELQAIDANQGLHNDLSRTKNVVYIKH